MRKYSHVLVKSEYIEYEYEYEYMTHKLYEYEYECFKNVLEYTSIEYFWPKSDFNQLYTRKQVWSLHGMGIMIRWTINALNVVHPFIQTCLNNYLFQDGYSRHMFPNRKWWEIKQLSLVPREDWWPISFDTFLKMAGTYPVERLHRTILSSE